LNSLSTKRARSRLGSQGTRRISGHLAVGVLALLLGSCATVTPRAPEATVKERAQARWDALVQGDFNKAYEYLSPGSRSVVTATDYTGNLRRGFWKAARVEKVECGSAQSCDVEATIEYELKGRRTKTPLRETWVKDGSEWWYLQK
jgi:hypothetical protein